MQIFSVAAKMTVQAGIGQSRASGLLQALAPPQAVLPLTAIPVCAFFASGGGDINSRAALMPTRPTGRDAFERRAPRKAGFMKLAEKSKRGGLRVKLARSRIMQVVTTRSEVPDLGRLPNKRFSDFVRRAKFEKYASAATLALLAETRGLQNSSI